MDASSDNNSNRMWAIANHTPANYALGGKIMLCFVIFLFVAVILILCFHTYARWLFHRQNRLHHRRIRIHLRSLSSAGDYASASSQALGRSVLETIPVFVYSTKSSELMTPLECAVCLSEFEENEEGRVLPKCNHVFHVGCIDTWFRSRSNCPLCRAPVQPSNPVTRAEAFSNQVAMTTVEPTSSNTDEDIETRRSSSSSSSSPSCSLSPSLSLSSSSPASFPPERSGRRPMELVGILVEMPRGFDDIELGLLGENGF